jgi:hypothetical protein
VIEIDTNAGITKTKHKIHCPNSPKFACPNYPVMKNELGEFGHRKQKRLDHNTALIITA